MYKVYIRIDSQQRVIGITSGEFISDFTGWIEIDEGDGDKYHHAQSHYLPEPLMTDGGFWRYKFESGAVSERTSAEIQTDVDNFPEPEPSLKELVIEQDQIISELLGLLIEQGVLNV